MIAMQTATGIQALYQALISGQEQVMVVEGGQIAQMKQQLLSTALPAVSQPGKAPAAAYAAAGSIPGSLLEKVQAALMQHVSRLLKVKLEDIDADTELNEYGFDSISSDRICQSTQPEIPAGTYSHHLF